MNEGKLKDKHSSKAIIKRYIPAVISIVILIVIRQLILEYQVAQNDSMSRIINISGRQRMLSQRISKDAYAIYLAEDKKTTDFYLNELKLSADMWKKSNIDLKKGNPKEGIKGDNSDKIIELFSKVEENHEKMLTAAYDIINMTESGNYNKRLIWDKVNVIQSNEGSFLKGMDNIVFQYDRESNDKLKVVGNTEIILFVVILIIIAFQVFYIFIPAEKSLSKAFDDIEESNENITKLFKIAHGATFLVDEESFQVMLMNKQAEMLSNIDNLDNKCINFGSIIQCESLEFCDVMAKIKNNEKIENMELTISINENKNIIVVLSSVKVSFNKRNAILIGLFDITIQKQAEEALKKLAVTDRLTGLYNRHFLDKKAQEEMEHSDRYKEPLAMAIFDLDHFKNVNDTWGHPVGDEVLKQTAQIASSMIRKCDFLFRAGGEEFLVLMPQTDNDAARLVAESIREALDKNIHPVVGKFTASFGVAEKIEAESFSNWYKRTDEALYRAKETGRNRVVTYDDKEGLPVALIHFEWKNEWSSGNEEIDNQHHEILDIGNSLIHMSLSNISFEKIIQNFDVFLEHIVDHFGYEEKVMREIGYPGCENHCEIHKNLLEKSLQMKESYKNGGFKSSTFFSFMVDDVILGHLVELDTKFFPYIRNEDVII